MMVLSQPQVGNSSLLNAQGISRLLDFALLFLVLGFLLSQSAIKDFTKFKLNSFEGWLFSQPFSLMA
jgi:hypothetical protein